MGQAFLHGNGGSNPLNFKVVASSTAPSSPKENTVWVKTSVAMPYAYLNMQPAPTWANDKGVVTITYEPIRGSGNITASTATLSLLSKKTNGVNRILAQFTGCYQNQDGTVSGWKAMNAYIYKSGSWVQFSSEVTRVYLYNAGDACESVTGGWKGNGTNTTSALVVEVEHASYEGSYSDFGEKTTIDKVTIPSSAKTLSITYTTSGDWDSLTNRPFGLKSSGYANGEKGTEKFVAYTTLAAGTNVTATLDISSFAGGSYCVAVKGDSGTSNITSNAVVTISKIWID